MKQLFLSLLMAGLVLFPAAAADEELNSTDAYIVREYAFISFTDEITPVDHVNVTPEEKIVGVAGNQTRRGGEMTARKLFHLKQEAKEGLEKVGIPPDDLLSNKSTVYTENNSKNCAGGVCIKPTGYGTF